MKIKPVGNWLLLKENKAVEKQFVGTVAIPDTAKSIMTLIVAEVVEVGPDASKPMPNGVGVDIQPGEIVFFKGDSPALQRWLSQGVFYLMLPSTHLVAKAAVDVAEA